MLSLSKRDSTGSYTQELWRQSPFSADWNGDSPGWQISRAGRCAWL